MFQDKIPTQPLSEDFKLEDGVATHMGDGAFVVLQADENGAIQSVYLTANDLRALRAHLG